MASAIIHIAVANELNKKLKRNSSKLLIGTIAPDISKEIGQNKVKSHFLDSKDTDIPNIKKFLNKYKNNLNDDFVLGYYIHLYTDYLWFKYFVTEFIHDNMITKLDGTPVKITDNMATLYIYNDYTDMNVKVIDAFNLDLKIFYNEIPILKDIIKEIPMKNIDIIVNKIGKIIEASKDKKNLVFNIDNIKQFVSTSIELIEADLKDLNIL